MILLRALLTVDVDSALLLLDRGWVPAQRLHIRFLVAHPGVVAGEAAVVGVDVGVAARAVHLIVDRLAWAALTAAASDVLRADFPDAGAESAAAPGGRRLVVDREATAVGAHVRVSTGAVRVVDFSSACRCQDAHRCLVLSALLCLFLFVGRDLCLLCLCCRNLYLCNFYYNFPQIK